MRDLNIHRINRRSVPSETLAFFADTKEFLGRTVELRVQPGCREDCVHCSDPVMFKARSNRFMTRMLMYDVEPVTMTTPGGEPLSVFRVINELTAHAICYEAGDSLQRLFGPTQERVNSRTSLEQQLARFTLQQVTRTSLYFAREPYVAVGM